MARTVGWLLLAYGCREDGPDGPGSDVPAHAELGEERRCPDPGRRSAARFDGFTSPRFRASVSWNWGGGSVLADFDGDGRLEVVAPTEPGLLLFRPGPDGEYELAPTDTLGRFGLTYASGGSAADYDGDGDLDLLVLRNARHRTLLDVAAGNHLLRNRGDGTFEDVTAEAGVGGCEDGCRAATTSAWGDVDGDGDLDLYVGNYGLVEESDGTTQDVMAPGDADFLYLNRGDGSFEDVSAGLPAAFQEGWTYNGGFFDLDDDGDLDLYSVNDFGARYPNRVLWNEGGAFVARTEERSRLVQSMTGMGLAVGDLNGDARPDLLVTQWGANALLESSAGGSWTDWADVRGFVGAADQRVGWGLDLGDLDNDGDEEVLAAYGWLESPNRVWTNPARQRDALYVRHAAGDGYRLVDEAPAWGLDDPGSGRGAFLADLDDDGWLDVWVRNLDAPDRLYRARCGDEASVTLDVRIPGSPNGFGVGTKLVARVGDRLHTRWITAGGSGFGSGEAPEAHVGLGDRERVDALAVRWPDGRWSRFRDLPARRRITLVRDE